MYHIYNTESNSIVWTCDIPEIYLRETGFELKHNFVELLGTQENPPSGLMPHETLVAFDTVNLSSKSIIHGWKIQQNVPLVIPLWAFRSIITLSGLEPTVLSLISGLNEPDKTIASIQWQYGNYIERNHPLIATLGQSIGLSEQNIDDVFINASMLK